MSCWTLCCLPYTFFSKSAATKERKPWNEPFDTPSCFHPAFLGLCPRGVHRWKGHPLCLTALVWKPGSDYSLCLGFCNTQALFFSLNSRHCYCAGPALAEGMEWISDHIQIYFPWAKSHINSPMLCSTFFKTFFEVATREQYFLSRQKKKKKRSGGKKALYEMQYIVHVPEFFLQLTNLKHRLQQQTVVFTQAVFMGQRCANDHAHGSRLRLWTWHRTFIISPDCQAPEVGLWETVSTFKQ